MKAARINTYGDPSVVKVQDIDIPVAGAGQVLVEVHAASLNPFDTAIRSGFYKEMIPLDLPVTIGGDIAGVVAQAGEGVDGFKPGDKVFGQANVVAGNSGAFAEFAVTSAGQLAHMPEGLSFEQAAALPLVAVSAYQALVEHIGLQSGQKILIHGGSGGIGTAAIMIAKHLGAEVAATSKTQTVEYVKSFNPDHIIDTGQTEPFARLSGYDALFDTVGGEDFTNLLKVLKPGGIAVSMIAQADKTEAERLGVRAVTQATKVTNIVLSQIKELVEQGVLKPQVDRVLTLAEVQDAFRIREMETLRGKVVLKIRG